MEELLLHACEEGARENVLTTNKNMDKDDYVYIITLCLLPFLGIFGFVLLMKFAMLLVYFLW